MPIYEYRCPNGHTFEAFQRMSDPPAQVCAVCGEGPVEKLLFPVAVHFKGSGFYSTDYGRKGKKAGVKDAEGAGAAAEKSPSADKDKSSKDTGSGEKKTSSGSD